MLVAPVHGAHPSIRRSEPQRRGVSHGGAAVQLTAAAAKEASQLRQPAKQLGELLAQLLELGSWLRRCCMPAAAAGQRRLERRRRCCRRGGRRRHSQRDGYGLHALH